MELVKNRFVFFWLVLLFLFSINQSVCQDNNFLIRGKIVDNDTQNPLPGVTIMDSLTGRGAITNDQGEFSFSFSRFPQWLRIKHLGYFNDSIIIKNKQEYLAGVKDKILIINLRADLFMLDEVLVTTPGMATRLFDREPVSIFDYVIKSNRYIALSYKNYNPLKPELILAELNGKVIFTLSLPSAKELYQDYQGDVYAITRDSAFLVAMVNDELKIFMPSEIGLFDKYVRPIQGLNSNYFFTLKKSEKGQYHDYFIHDVESKEFDLIYRVGHVGDERIVSSLDRQIRAQEVGKIKRSFIGRIEMRIINSRIASLHIRKFSEFRPVESAFIQMGDSSLLFDFDKKLINCIKSNGELKWTSNMQVPLRNDWTGNVHYDKIAQRFYLEFLHIQLSSLVEIDPLTGEALSQIPIKRFKHIDNITVLNNRIFFLHQPDFGDRGKKLYFVKM